MPDKIYRLIFQKDDGTEESVEFTAPQGPKGDKGDTGAAGKDGADGAPGANGKDGTSATHSWNGTTLTITSASGTSSANLKGEKGDKGDTGATGATGSQGPKGDTGATGPAGANGKDGKTPVKGTDYFTAADKAEMVEDVKASMDGIPSYWQTALDDGAKSINTALCEAGRNKSAFLFYSDAHWNQNSQMSPKLLKHLYKNTGMTKTFFGGDIVTNESTDYDGMKYLWERRTQLKDLPNHHSVVGNHDDGNATNNLFSEQYVYGYVIAPEETPDMVIGNGFYYYVDNIGEKTRYLCLDTAYKGVDSEQKTFITDALKSTPDNWHIVVVAHIWYQPDYSQYSVKPIPIIGLDGNATTVCTILDNYNSRSGEFADCGAKVEFCIGGHVHRDYIGTTGGGIPIILVETDSKQVRGEFTCTTGTATEASVNGIIADYGKNEVNVIRIGRGNSFIVDLSTGGITDIPGDTTTPIYTNVIPLSIDSTGAIFNGGKGWADKGRIGSGKLDSYIGGGDYYITGHIEIDPTIDNTIRMKNITFKSDTTIDKIGIAFYDASFTRVLMNVDMGGSNWLVPSTIANVTNAYNTVLDGTNIVQFTFENGVHINNTAIKYFAICAEYIGDDSIITINEEITAEKPSYTNVLDIPEIGYQLNREVSTSTYEERDSSGGYDLTGYIPTKYGDIIYLKNVTMPDNVTTRANTIYYYDSNKTWAGSFNCTSSSGWEPVFENGNLVQFTCKQTGYIRINAQDINETSIITINEPITDSGDSGGTTPTYTNVLDTVGYKENYRLSGGSGGEVANDGTDISGFIPFVTGQRLYLKDVAWKLNDSGYGGFLGVYKADKSYNVGFKLTDETLNDSDWEMEVDENGYVTKARINFEDMAYIRVCALNINETSIITINEPIE